MAREFDGPLSKEDLAWAKSRLPGSQVDRLIALYGLKKSAKGDDAADKAAEKAAEEQAKANAEAEAAAAEAAANAHVEDGQATTEAAQAAADDANLPPTEGEDLIGTPTAFDVLHKTEAEVKTWAEGASDEDKAAALATEQGREDRDARKGVVALLS